MTLYNNNNDSDNNYHVLGVYYTLLTALYIHQVMKFLQPLFKGDSINLIYTRGNKDLEKPNNLLKDKVSLLSRFRITTRACLPIRPFKHVEIYLYARNHVRCKEQYKDVLTMIPPFKESITLCHLVNDI